jgi:hypothetical protein
MGFSDSLKGQQYIKHIKIYRKFQALLKCDNNVYFYELPVVVYTFVISR